LPISYPMKGDRVPDLLETTQATDSGSLGQASSDGGRGEAPGGRGGGARRVSAVPTAKPATARAATPARPKSAAPKRRKRRGGRPRGSKNRTKAVPHPQPRCRFGRGDSFNFIPPALRTPPRQGAADTRRHPRAPSRLDQSPRTPASRSRTSRGRWASTEPAYTASSRPRSSKARSSDAGCAGTRLVRSLVWALGNSSFYAAVWMTVDGPRGLIVARC